MARSHLRKADSNSHSKIDLAPSPKVTQSRTGVMTGVVNRPAHCETGPISISYKGKEPLSNVMQRSFRYYYLKIVRQRGTPEKVALGVAVGVFVGMAFPPGFHMGIAFAIAWTLRCSRAAAVIATWISNPFTIPVFLYAQMAIGCWLLGITRKRMTPENLWDFIKNIPAHKNILLAWVLGALITGLASAMISYFVARPAIVAFRKQKEERRQRRHALSGRARAAVSAESSATRSQ